MMKSNSKIPKRSSYKKGYFKVSDGHKLYYELYGNPNGVPVVALHGGPGSGFSERFKTYFNPKIYNVLLFDQRGAARSKPFVSLKANTTQKLVDDITALMDFVGFDKAIFYGGSWGSTLALVFAIQNPDRVFHMVLRSLFLANRDAMDYYIKGQVANFYPDVWQRFIAMVPVQSRHNPLRYYYQKMKSGAAATRKKFAEEWTRYELTIAPLVKPSEAKIQKMLGEFSFQSLGTLEAHYIAQNCFLPEDYILKNAHKISNVPLDLLHGHYDLVCPAKHAHTLHQLLPKSSLKLFVMGHFMTGKECVSHTKLMLNKAALRWKKHSQ